MERKFLGIDIGSTAAKAVVLDEKGEIEQAFTVPTGWSSFEALKSIGSKLSMPMDEEHYACIATGYGRNAVAFAGKTMTEITCHAKGAMRLFGENPMNVVDVGGQDTKVITCQGKAVEEFFMNDKCSAGTGKFLEVMANRLNISLEELNELARKHTEEVKISSMCTVFAESEVISLVGQGVLRENIAYGILQSVAGKVSQMLGKLRNQDLDVYLTGGLCEAEYFRELLSDVLERPIHSDKYARYAGALGAAVFAKEQAEKGRI